MNNNFRTAFAAAAIGAGIAFAPLPAEAVPSSFTAVGEAQTWDAGRPTTVPNTLHYQRGKIRLEMAAPVSADGVAPFNVVLAREGGKTITLLNPKEKQAMKLEVSTLDELAENRSLQKISQFKLSEFATTFKGQSKAIGHETIAGEACTVREYKGKDGHFKMWLADKHEIPFKFVYFEKGKPTFQWAVSRFTTTSSLPASSFNIPAGYETTDLSEMLKGVELDVKHRETR